MKLPGYLAPTEKLQKDCRLEKRLLASYGIFRGSAAGEGTVHLKYHRFSQYYPTGT